MIFNDELATQNVICSVCSILERECFNFDSDMFQGFVCVLAANAGIPVVICQAQVLCLNTLQGFGVPVILSGKLAPQSTICNVCSNFEKGCFIFDVDVFQCFVCSLIAIAGLPALATKATASIATTFISIMKVSTTLLLR